MIVRVLLLVVSVALFGFAPAPFPRKGRPGGPAAVNGTWEVVACEHRGAANESIRANYVIEMTRGEAVFVEMNKKQRTVYPMKLDAKASPPSFAWMTGNRVGYVGSYRLEKDRMTLIFAPGSQVTDRPVDFTGTPTWKYRLRRVKRN